MLEISFVYLFYINHAINETFFFIFTMSVYKIMHITMCMSLIIKNKERNCHAPFTYTQRWAQYQKYCAACCTMVLAKVAVCGFRIRFQFQFWFYSIKQKLRLRFWLGPCDINLRYCLKCASAVLWYQNFTCGWHRITAPINKVPTSAYILESFFTKIM